MEEPKTVPSSSFVPSDYTEEMFSLLQEQGLKPHDPSERMRTNMDAVFGNNKPKNIGVHVDIALARDKDQALPHRTQLAQEVRDTVQNELGRLMVSSSQPYDAMLCVRVCLVSDGSSLGRRFTSSVGKAKLTLAYCLECLTTGEVGLANEVYVTQDCSPGQSDLSYWEYSSAVVRSMARNVAVMIHKEVSEAVEDWASHRTENQERLERIKLRLANEDNLDQSDYAFAVEHHLL